MWILAGRRARWNRAESERSPPRESHRWWSRVAAAACARDARVRVMRVCACTCESAGPCVLLIHVRARGCMRRLSSSTAATWRCSRAWVTAPSIAKRSLCTVVSCGA
eukprot:3636170-Pleurochrysis_carterae.AAC.4